MKLKEKITIADFEGKKFKIKLIEPETNKKAIVTHYLHNFHNGVKKHYKKDAEKFIKEAARVLHSGNTFIITSWYLWRPRYLTKLLLSSLKSMFFLTSLDIGDMMHTFGKDKHSRYLHAFTERGLRRLLEKNGFEVVGSEIASRSSGSGEQNILVIARKK